MSLNLFQSLPSPSLSHSWWPFLFSLSLPGLPLVSILSKNSARSLPLHPFCTFFSLPYSLPPAFFIIHPLFLPLCPIFFPVQKPAQKSLSPLPAFVSQLPGAAASLQARVRCCPMCEAEGADPGAGGGVQGARGGHGVRTQGSRDGHRRGLFRGSQRRPAGRWCRNTLSHCYACHCQCQHQFRNRRWNCSTTPRGINVFGRVMNQGFSISIMCHGEFLHADKSIHWTTWISASCALSWF